MPTSFLSADTNFPRLTADQPVEERLGKIQNYLYMLLEELRYTLSNLGEENFNEKTLAELGETITGPISRTVTDLAGNVSTLEQTAESLTTRVSDAEGNITSLQQTSTSITARLNDVDGNNTTIEAFATGITSTVSDLDGDISQVSQTADKINWVVASGGTASTFTLTSHMADLVADEISITGVVTFNDLETVGQSVINGDNIELKADADGDSVSYLTYKSVNDNTFAELHTRDNQTGTTSDRDRYAFVIETPAVVDGDYCALKLESGDNMSLESGWLLYMSAFAQIVINSRNAATRIVANETYSSMPYEYKTQANAYYFCTDGIYYGNQLIVST